MKSLFILPLAIMLASTSMFGQSLTQPPRIDPSKCPVGLEVEQNGSLVAYKNAYAGPPLVPSDCSGLVVIHPTPPSYGSLSADAHRRPGGYAAGSG